MANGDCGGRRDLRVLAADEAGLPEEAADGIHGRALTVSSPYAIFLPALMGGCRLGVALRERTRWQAHRRRVCLLSVLAVRRRQAGQRTGARTGAARSSGCRRRRDEDHCAACHFPPCRGLARAVSRWPIRSSRSWLTAAVSRRDCLSLRRAALPRREVRRAPASSRLSPARATAPTTIPVRNSVACAENLIHPGGRSYSVSAAVRDGCSPVVRSLRHDDRLCCFEWPIWASRTCSHCCGFFRRATGTRTSRSWRYATRSRSWSGSLARPGRTSCPVTGRSWPSCCTASRGTCCASSGCWSGQRQCCAGTGTRWRAATLPSHARRAQADRVPPAPSIGWCCAWRGRIPAGLPPHPR